MGMGCGVRLAGPRMAAVSPVSDSGRAGLTGHDAETVHLQLERLELAALTLDDPLEVPNQTEGSA